MLDYTLTVRTNYCDSNNVVHAYNMKTFIASGENTLDLGSKGLYEAYKYQIEKIKKHEDDEDIIKKTKLINNEYHAFGGPNVRAHIAYTEYKRVGKPIDNPWYDHTTIEYDLSASNRLVFDEDGHIKLDEKTSKERKELLRRT